MRNKLMFNTSSLFVIKQTFSLLSFFPSKYHMNNLQMLVKAFIVKII